jgi:hypothetical protein
MESKWAQAEMKGAVVWDPRCRRSLATMVERLSQHPEESFSKACGPAARQAAHRIFEHPSSTPEGLLQGHFAQTARRCEEHPLVLAVQDSTEFDFTSHKATADLGPLGQGFTRGLMGHSVLAVSPEGLPLGLLHLAVWARDPAQRGQKRARKQRPTREKESQKWPDGLAGTEAALPPEQPVLVVADARRPNTDLLVRACQPRLVTVARPDAEGGEERASLLLVAKSAPVVGFMTVRVPRRPGRPEHEVTLQVRATAGQIQPPRHRQAGEPNTPQAVSILCATEVEPPAGEKPIEWILVTTRAATSAEAACQMVRYYAEVGVSGGAAADRRRGLAEKRAGGVRGGGVAPAVDDPSGPGGAGATGDGRGGAGGARGPGGGDRPAGGDGARGGAGDRQAGRLCGHAGHGRAWGEVALVGMAPTRSHGRGLSPCPPAPFAYDT